MNPSQLCPSPSPPREERAEGDFGPARALLQEPLRPPDTLLRVCLLPFYPLLGLLWSGSQRRLARLGFVPHSLSGASIITVFACSVTQAVCAVSLLDTTFRTGNLMIGGLLRAVLPFDQFQLGPIAVPVMLLDFLLLFLFVTDTIVRHSHHLNQDQWAGGFLEWVVRRKPLPAPAHQAT